MFSQIGCTLNLKVFFREKSVAYMPVFTVGMDFGYYTVSGADNTLFLFLTK